MSTRKRPLNEISVPNLTPSRYAPSTPHAVRALQQRSGAKTRSARSARHQDAEAVRPDSIRGVLRRFAKISAPITTKRIVTPTSVYTDKENRNTYKAQEDDNDSAVLKPHLTFAIEESLDEDSELPIAPTPSVLPDDEDYEQPTITFQNAAHIPIGDRASERSNRRSRMSEVHSEPIMPDEQEEQEADITIMTERGRRALSEEATGRLSRYSFGSIRMSDFGSELEIRRQSDVFHKPAITASDEYIPLDENDLINGGDTEDLRKLIRSPFTDDPNDTIQLSAVGDETFRLEIPPDEDEADAQAVHTNALKGGGVANAPTSLEQDHNSETMFDEVIDQVVEDNTARRQTLLETATTRSHVSRRKRLKLTRHGTLVPSLPASVIRRVVLGSYEDQSKRKPKLGRDHMRALEQATEWFFEQAAEDLAAYSSHGRRKKRVNTDDALLLMRRQKVLNEDGELRRMAKTWLSKDVIDGLDLPDNV